LGYCHSSRLCVKIEKMAFRNHTLKIPTPARDTRPTPLSDTCSYIAGRLGAPARIANEVVAVTTSSDGEALLMLQRNVEVLAQWRDREQTQWLLDFIQCPASELGVIAQGQPRSSSAATPREVTLFGRTIKLTPAQAKAIADSPPFNPLGDFVVDFATDAGGRAPQVSNKELLRFRAEVARAVRAFLREPHKEWKVAPGGSFVRSLRWHEHTSRPIAVFFARDWRVRFKLRAIDLLASQGPRIRQCEDPKCARPWFLQHDGRQRFCSPGCADRVRIGRFKAKQNATNQRARAEKPSRLS
jgi:hypothetical protein